MPGQLSDRPQEGTTATRRLPSRLGRLGNGRAALGWALLFYVCGQLLWTVLLDSRRPTLYDPEFGRRLATLRARMAEEPGRPLLLLVGSSRTVVSFRPEVLPPLPATDAGTPLVFNFSHVAAGPVMNLMQVRRLLREGIRPDWLVVEVLPPKLFREGQSLLASFAAAGDLRTLKRYQPAWKLYGRYLQNRLLTNHSLPRDLVRCINGWGSTAPASGEFDMDRLGGFTALKERIDADERRRQLEIADSQWSWASGESRVSPTADLAMRALLDLCERRRIKVVLLLTPEGPYFRRFYSPAGLQQINEFCTVLARKHGVPLVDARDWLDEEDFLDSHHPLRRGADTFTLRLGKEVFEPLVEGALPVEE